MNNTTDPEYAARKWLSDCGNEDQADTVLGLLDELDTLRARFAEMEAGEVSTEWGVRWPGEWEDGTDVIEGYDDDRETAAFAARASSGEVVQREVRTWRGPWKPVAS